MSQSGTVKLSHDDVSKVAKLANLTLSKAAINKFTTQLISVLEYVAQIQELDTTKVKETHQVTDTKNVFREDKIDHQRLLTQAQALSGARRTHQGYFVVPRIIED